MLNVSVDLGSAGEWCNIRNKCKKGIQAIPSEMVALLREFLPAGRLGEIVMGKATYSCCKHAGKTSHRHSWFRGRSPVGAVSRMLVCAAGAIAQVLRIC